MIRTFFFSLMIFLCFVLFEAVFLSNLTILPAIPDFVLLTSLYVSLHNGALLGETSGFCSGLMLDFLSSGPLGFNCLLRTIIGFLCGLLDKTINTAGVFLPMLLGFCVTVLKLLLSYTALFFFPNIQIHSLFSAAVGFELIANTLLAPCMFSFLSLFSSHLLLEAGEQ
ncbi:MAG: rod shape-determining protein MreD [Bacteroides sp.]|nr:rod shape-determining protein MreD [Prevotella sp.]MCM1407902.1 rod shape-determining protein MreD [Treponema brennaborense]MCM1469644.1 rod shape-determining protein MreD [Bacteroides sp.]